MSRFLMKNSGGNKEDSRRRAEVRFQVAVTTNILEPIPDLKTDCTDNYDHTTLSCDRSTLLALDEIWF